LSHENSHPMSKKEIKNFIKSNLYLALKEVLTQIIAQLNVYSDKCQIVNKDKWYRLIDNTFKRNLRNAHKEIKKRIIEDNYWNQYHNCINIFIEDIKNHPVGDEIEDAQDIILKLWGGIPKFDIIKINGKDHLIYIVLKSNQKDVITKIGYFLLSLRRRNQTSEIDVKNLEEITKIVFNNYNTFPVEEFLLYLTPYNVNSFSFKFKRKKLLNLNLEEEYIETESTETIDDSHFDDNLEDKVVVKQIDPQINQSYVSEYEWVGKLIQTQKKPMRQGRMTRRVEDIEIEGWLYEKYCHLAQHNRFFIAQDPKLGTINENKVNKGHRRRLLIKINDFKDWSQNVAHEISDDPKLGHYTQCWFNFEKFLEPDNYGSYKAVPIAGTGLDQYKIRDLTPDEYHFAYELPDNGVPIGLFLHDNDVTIKRYPITKIPFYFPVSDKNYEQLFYTPTFIVGRPGSGKTNTLKTLTASSLSCNDYCSHDKPAFIFFDYEGQFRSLANPSLENIGDSEDKEVWNFLNIKPVNFNDVEIISNPKISPKQFSFKELFKDLNINQKVKTLQYFLRNLSEITEIAFKEISRKIFSNNNPETYSEFRKEFKKALENQTIDAAKVLTKGQRQALIRTFHDDISRFFDQKGTPFDLNTLIRPGKVIVFDLKGLPKEMVILYVLLILQKLKLETNLLKYPVIVVIDEAHEIFKNVTGSSKEARYYTLISKFLAEFGSRGRKYRLGLWLASQRPQDLHNDIQKVVGTYLILGLNPEHKRWLTNTLGSSKNADFILNLPNRYALFKNSSLYKGATQLLKLIKSPNIHRTFV